MSAPRNLEILKFAEFYQLKTKNNNNKDRLYISEYKVFATGGNVVAVIGKVLVQCWYYECLAWFRTFIPGGPSSPAGPFSPGSP